MKEKKGENEIRRCPFCGSIDIRTGHPFVAVQIHRMYIIHCNGCDCQFIPRADSMDEAIEAWNRRVKG